MMADEQRKLQGSAEDFADEPEFAAEQAHLNVTYDTIQRVARLAAAKLERVAVQAAADKESMASEVTMNTATEDDATEMWADFHAINQVIAGYNLSHDLEAKKLAARAFSKAAANDITNTRGFARLAIDEAVHLVLDWNNFEDGEEIARIGVDFWEMVAEETGRPEDYRELAEAYGMLQDIATGNCASSECLSELAEKEHAAREIVSRYSPKR